MSMPRRHKVVLILGWTQTIRSRWCKPSSSFEARVLLDSQPLLPPSTSLAARSYTTAAMWNNQISITYTVYNEQSDALGGVLLTDTLKPGVTFTAPPSRRTARPGPAWARERRSFTRYGDATVDWPIRTIAGYGRRRREFNGNGRHPATRPRARS